MLIPDGFVKLLTHEQISWRLKEIAAELRQDLAGRDVTFVGVLDGALFVLTDLLRALNVDVQIDFLRVSSYGAEMTSGKLNLISGLTWNINGHDVFVVDDILDSGKTLAFCREHLLSLGAKSVRAVVLLAKEREQEYAVGTPIVGFKIPDEFVIGYGLDWKGRYRHLPDIYAKKR